MRKYTDPVPPIEIIVTNNAKIHSYRSQMIVCTPQQLFVPQNVKHM